MQGRVLDIPDHINRQDGSGRVLDQREDQRSDE
jgi:hypothetical protein